MMSSYIKFETEAGTPIFVEGDTKEVSPTSHGTQKAGLIKDTIAVAKETFEVAKETFEKAVSQAIRCNTQVFVNAIQSLEIPPYEAEITFGLKASGEVGNFVITKASGEVNYNVKLLWKFEQKNKS